MVDPAELYGKCRELGFCDCGGFFGCTDNIKSRPDEDNLEAHRVELHPGDSSPKIAQIEQSDMRGKTGRKCPACGVRLSKRHVCKRPNSPKRVVSRVMKSLLPEPKDVHADSVLHPGTIVEPLTLSAESQSNLITPKSGELKPPMTIVMPDHEIIIKLAGVEIIIRPLEVTS